MISDRNRVDGGDRRLIREREKKRLVEFGKLSALSKTRLASTFVRATPFVQGASVENATVSTVQATIQ